MPWKHEWWCPICWAILLFHGACKLVHIVVQAYRFLVVTPVYAVTHPVWLSLKILRLLFTTVRVPILFLLVILYERGWNQVVSFVWWVLGTPRVGAALSFLGQVWDWVFSTEPLSLPGPSNIQHDRAVFVSDRVAADERVAWSEPPRALALTSEPAWPGPILTSS